MSDRILFMVIYVIFVVFLFGLISIYVFGRVSFWFLCIVIVYVSFSGNCCFLWNVSRYLEVIVRGGIGIYFGKVLINDSFV